MNKSVKRLMKKAEDWDGEHIDDYAVIIDKLRNEHTDYFWSNRWAFCHKHDYAGLGSIMTELYEKGWVIGEGFMESDKLGNIMYYDAYGNIELTNINLVIRDWIVEEGIDAGELKWFGMVWNNIPYETMIDLFDKPLEQIRKKLVAIKLTYA